MSLGKQSQRVIDHRFLIKKMDFQTRIFLLATNTADILMVIAFPQKPSQVGVLPTGCLAFFLTVLNTFISIFPKQAKEEDWKKEKLMNLPLCFSIILYGIWISKNTLSYSSIVFLNMKTELMWCYQYFTASSQRRLIFKHSNSILILIFWI